MKMKRMKSRFGYAIKFSLAVLVINYMFNLTAMAQVIDTVKQLPSIFIPKEVGDARKKWFIDHKYDIINRLAIKDGAKEELQEVYFKDAKVLSNMLDEFLRFKNMDGMRIYIGSRRIEKKETQNEDKVNCGKIKLIMVPTKKHLDVTSLFKKKYYTLNGGEFKKIYKNDARDWIEKYQNVGEKRKALDSTLTAEDLSKGNFETKHVFFENIKVRELRDEINDWVNKKPGAGLKIRLVSYNNADSVEGVYKGMVKQNFKQRLTVDFVFTDPKGNEVYISDSTLIARKKMAILNHINLFLEKKSVLTEQLNLPNTVENWNKILELLNRKEFLKIRDKLNSLYSMDTGVPAPPPYLGSDSMAELDIEP